MTQKMVLLPFERFKALEKINSDNSSPIPPDVEVKMLQQKKIMSTRKPQPKESQVSIEKTIKTMPPAQAERSREILKHISKHKDHIKIDEKTGELQYDGTRAAESDVRDLVSTLTSNKRRKKTPRGWNLFMTSLNDTQAPADLHLGWKWEKSTEKGDWGALKDE